MRLLRVIVCLFRRLTGGSTTVHFSRSSFGRLSYRRQWRVP